MAAPYSISTNQTGGNGLESTVATMASLHGEVVCFAFLHCQFLRQASDVSASLWRAERHPQAARRRAIGELIFFAGVNDKHRCKRIVDAWRIKLDAEETCADYDRRTPLHVAAAEGSWATSEWLLRHGASINAVDRFGRTPLEEAVRGEFPEIVQLLLQNGARVCEKQKLVALQDSALAGVVQYRPSAAPEIGIEAEWEIDAQDLQLFNKLGEGEFGEVFKAKYNGTYVAVKQLKRSDQIAIGDFRTEMSTLRRIHHPNAVQFLGACTRSHPYIIVTELMSCSLMTAFQLTFRLTLRRQVEIALEFARAMAYMHDREPKIIHRDLKPANIMIGGSSYMLADTSVLLHTAGIVKVADFGLCKSLPMRGTRPTDETRSTREREELKDTFRLTGETGSYRYMAPEVFLHEPYNTSVDVYSFAMICYQLFEACVPFEGVDALSAARQAALNNLRPAFAPLSPNTPNKDVREDLRSLLGRCWAADYMTRPPFPQIIKTLEAVLMRLPARKAAADPASSSGCCTQQ